MARLPMYQQQTVMDAPRASGAEFGGQVGQAMAQTGNVLQDIGVTMKRREDVIDRTVRARDFDAFAQEALRALETQDLARAETVDQYRQGLSAKMQEVLDAHPGTTASKAEFKNQLLNQMHQYERGAREAQVKAQHTLLGEIVEQRTNQIATQIAFAPELMDQGFEELDAHINQFSDALPAGAVEQYRNSGRSNVVSTALSRLLSEDSVDAADAILKNPEYSKYLNPDQSRRFVIESTATRGKIDAETRRQNAQVARWTARLGTLTPQQETIIRNMPAAKDMTPADEILEYELVTGRPAPPAVVDRIYKVAAESSGVLGGNSLQAQALRYITENAPAYANGMLTAEQARVFETMYAEAYKPTERIDPSTGQITRIPPTVPTFAQEAMQRGSQRYGGTILQQNTSIPTAGGTPMPGQRVQLDINGQTIGQATVDPSGRWSIPAPPETPAAPTGSGQPSPAGMGQVETLWSRRRSLAGIAPAVASGIRSFPIGGPQVAGAIFGEDEAAKIQQDREFATGATNALVKVLQESPRFAEGERQQILNEISLAPEMFKSVEAFESRMFAIGDNLLKKKLDAVADLQNPNATAELQRAARNDIANIDNFFKTLGLPYRPKTEEDMLLIPPGAVFVDRAGNEYIRE